MGVVGVVVVPVLVNTALSLSFISFFFLSFVCFSFSFRSFPMRARISNVREEWRRKKENEAKLTAGGEERAWPERIEKAACFSGNAFSRGQRGEKKERSGEMDWAKGEREGGKG